MINEVGGKNEGTNEKGLQQSFIAPDKNHRVHMSPSDAIIIRPKCKND